MIIVNLKLSMSKFGKSINNGYIIRYFEKLRKKKLWRKLYLISSYLNTSDSGGWTTCPFHVLRVRFNFAHNDNPWQWNMMRTLINNTNNQTHNFRHSFDW